MISRRQLHKRLAALERRVDKLSKEVAALRKRKSNAGTIDTKNKNLRSKVNIRLSDIVFNWGIVRLIISILRIVFYEIISVVHMVFDILDTL